MQIAISCGHGIYVRGKAGGGGKKWDGMPFPKPNTSSHSNWTMGIYNELAYMVMYNIYIDDIDTFIVHCGLHVTGQ